MPLPLATWVTGERVFLARLVPELAPVGILPLLLNRGDLHRHVVGVAIDRHAALDDRKRELLGFQVTIIGADQSRQLCPCGMPHHEERVRVAAVLLGVIVDPADRLGDVACHLLDASPSARSDSWSRRRRSPGPRTPGASPARRSCRLLASHPRESRTRSGGSCPLWGRRRRGSDARSWARRRRCHDGPAARQREPGWREAGKPRGFALWLVSVKHRWHDEALLN